MAELPHGTVTFAFTDVEGSTALLKQLGEGYADVLGAHRRLVRGAFAAHGGVEIDTQGDAFFFAFVRARDAVAAAADVQRAHDAHDWPEAADVRMRVGLHTGEPTVGEEGYLGLDVVRAARLCGACRGGHVLLSETTRALVGSTLPAGVSVYPLGERQLKDIDEPERVYELEIEGLAGGPAARTAGRGPSPPPPPAPPDPPAPAPASRRERKARERDWEADFERRVEGFAERTADGVLSLIERSLGSLGGPEAGVEREPGGAAAPSGPPAGNALEDFAARAEELGRRIEQELRQASGDAPRPDDG